MLDRINEGFFGGFFDFDGNGKLDALEEALEIAAIDYIINGDGDAADDEEDDDLSDDNLSDEDDDNNLFDN